MPHPLTCRECGHRAVFNLGTQEALCPSCGHRWTPTEKHWYFNVPTRDASEEGVSDWARAIVERMRSDGVPFRDD